MFVCKPRQNMRIVQVGCRHTSPKRCKKATVAIRFLLDCAVGAKFHLSLEIVPDNCGYFFAEGF